jgi:NTE family protein
MISMSQPKVVFVLSGGGNLGAVQVGMLYALVESGIRPEAVVGTSIGALNGAFLVGRCDLAGVEALDRVWSSVRRSDVFPLNVRAVVRGIGGHKGFICEPTGLSNIVAAAQLGFDRLEDAPIPLRVVATEIPSGEPIVLGHGDLIPALLASSAIPGVFPSVQIDGRTLVDGALVANTPVRQAEEFDPDVIYVLPALTDQAGEAYPNAIVTMQRAVALAVKQSDRYALADVASRRVVRVIPVPQSASQVSAFDFNSTKRLVRDAHKLALSWLRHEDEPPAQAGRRPHRALPIRVLDGVGPAVA